MKIERHMGIVAYLVEQQKSTAQELATLFHVSPRTIMRDLDDLSLAGIPLYTVQGKNGGIFLMNAFNIKKPPMTHRERQALETSLKTRYQVLGDDATFNAILKLNKGQGYADFEHDLTLSPGNLALRGRVFQLLQAIQTTRCIAFDYMNAQGERSLKKCQPYRIVFKERSWYLDAFDCVKERFSVYKVARITNLIQKETFVRKSYVAHPYDGGTWLNTNKIPVVLHVKQIVLHHFVERLGHDHIQHLTDDSYEVIYPLADNQWGYNLLLGFGVYVTVIGPLDFRQHFLEYLGRVKAKYPR